MQLPRWYKHAAATSLLSAERVLNAVDGVDAHLGRVVGKCGGEEHIKHKCSVRIWCVGASQNEHTSHVDALCGHSHMNR